MTSHDLVCMTAAMRFWRLTKLNSRSVASYPISIACSIARLLVLVLFFDLPITFSSIALTCCAKCARMYCLSNKLT